MGLRKAARRVACGAALLAALAPGAARAGITLYEAQRPQGRSELRLYGRLQGDFLLHDEVDPLVITDDAELRRARLGLRLRWRDDWLLRLSGSFVDGARLGEASLEYRGWPVRLQLGRFQEPFGLAGSGSSSDTLLMERPSAAFLGPFYGLGAAGNVAGRAWGLTAGLFTSKSGSDLVGDEPEQAATLRATARPWRTRLGYWHIGTGLSLRKLEEDIGVRLSGRDESALLDGISPRAVRQIQADAYRLAGVETALRLGATLIAAEHIRADVESGPGWSGEYLEAGWALTGERRGYSTRYGLIGGITPRRSVLEGGPGAIELAARWSATDLADGGGNQGQVLALGLNWYPIEQLRLSVNAQRIEREFADGGQREADIVQARAQLSF